MKRTVTYDNAQDLITALHASRERYKRTELQRKESKMSKTDNLEVFEVVITAEPDLKITIKGKDPCNVLMLSHMLVESLKITHKRKVDAVVMP